MPGTSLKDNPKLIVKEQFSKIKTISELASLLNYIEKKFTSNKSYTKIISSRDLNYLAQSKDKRYSEFFIKKKSGFERNINAPDEYLKRVQQLLNILLQIVFQDKVHNCTNGFLFDRNIVRNALPHVDKRYVLNMDIKDFFPSVNFRRIKKVLEFEPFNLVDTREFIGFIITNISVYNGILPQGAPTSPIISNIVTQKLDRRISKYCDSLKVKYTRYADDLSFSSNKSILTFEFQNKIISIIKEEGFTVNADKTRLNTNRQRQEVTGIIVNKKLNINRTYLKKVRTILHNWEIRGDLYTQQIFEKHYSHKEKGSPDFRKVVSGYIHFIGLVRGKNDELFNKLLFKFGYLNNQINYEFISHSSVRNKLVKDNKRMELILFDKIHSSDEKFISFCTAAFHQIENLMYYFYWRRFVHISDLLKFLFDNNPELQKKWKKNLPNYEKISNLNISILVYAFEKEFYFDKSISYKKDITLLREARNDDSHRCQVVSFDIPKVKTDYQHIRELNAAYFEKHKKFRPLSKAEEQTKVKYKLVRLLEEKNYNRVRSILRKIVEQIKQYNF